MPKLPPLEGKVMCQWTQGCCSMAAALWKFALAAAAAPAPRANNAASLFTESVESINNRFSSCMGVCNNTPRFGVLSVHVSWTSFQYYKFSAGIDNLLNHNYKEYLSLYIHKRFGCSVGAPIFEPGRVWWMKLGIAL